MLVEVHQRVADLEMLAAPIPIPCVHVAAPEIGIAGGGVEPSLGGAGRKRQEAGSALRAEGERQLALDQRQLRAGPECGRPSIAEAAIERDAAAGVEKAGGPDPGGL